MGILSDVAWEPHSQICDENLDACITGNNC